jgi:hypothetical protein
VVEPLASKHESLISNPSTVKNEIKKRKKERKGGRKGGREGGRKEGRKKFLNTVAFPLIKRGSQRQKASYGISNT